LLDVRRALAYSHAARLRSTCPAALASFRKVSCVASSASAGAEHPAAHRVDHSLVGENKLPECIGVAVAMILGQDFQIVHLI